MESLLRRCFSCPYRQKQLKVGLFPSAKCTQTNCTVCTRTKYNRRSNGTPTGETKAGRLHVDTGGHLEEQSTEGHRYFLTVVEAYSRYIFASSIRTKTEASDALLHFIKYFEKQYGHAFRAVRVDAGGIQTS